MTVYAMTPGPTPEWSLTTCQESGRGRGAVNESGWMCENDVAGRLMAAGMLAKAGAKRGSRVWFADVCAGGRTGRVADGDGLENR